MNLNKATKVVDDLTDDECDNLWRGCWLNVQKFKVVAFITAIASCGYNIRELFQEAVSQHGTTVADYLV